MTSQITTSANIINTTYPVAGQDNDSQGFRDNFSAIQTSLYQAANEITKLQLYTAQTTTSTNFNNNIVKGAVFTNNAGLVDASAGYTFAGGGGNGFDTNLTGGNGTVSFANGEYFIANLTTSTTYTIVGFPGNTSNGYSLGKMRFHLNATNVINSATWSVSFNTANANSTATVFWVDNLDKWTGAYSSTYKPASQQFFDVWSFDGGYTLYVKYLGISN
jgi:hypothetical protein